MDPAQMARGMSDLRRLVGRAETGSRRTPSSLCGVFEIQAKGWLEPGHPPRRYPGTPRSKPRPAKCGSSPQNGLRPASEPSSGRGRSGTTASEGLARDTQQRCHEAGPRRGCVRHDHRGGAMSAVRAPETQTKARAANGQGADAVDREHILPANPTATDRLLAELLEALRNASAGQADVRLSTRRQGMGKEVAKAFNDFMELT